MQLIKQKKKIIKYPNKNTSDAILDFLVSKGVKKVFLLTGGAIAFTVDAFSKRKDISYICVQHEQAAAMMADAYARVNNSYAATMVTSGPGATNLITGIACSYFDSIANIHITGQVNLDDVAGRLDMKPRTLRTRLTEAGTNFNQLLADYRCNLAKRLLSGTDESIDEIVYLTGFSEPSTFYRAFKRWTNQTPVEYRNSRRS